MRFVERSLRERLADIEYDFIVREARPTADALSGPGYADLLRKPVGVRAEIRIGLLSYHLELRLARVACRLRRAFDHFAMGCARRSGGRLFSLQDNHVDAVDRP